LRRTAASLPPCFGALIHFIADADRRRSSIEISAAAAAVTAADIARAGRAGAECHAEQPSIASTWFL